VDERVRKELLKGKLMYFVDENRHNTFFRTFLYFSQSNLITLKRPSYNNIEMTEDGTDGLRYKK